MVAAATVIETRLCDRLVQAIEDHPLSPEGTHGRATWLQKRLEHQFNCKVSVYTVTRWFKGEVNPSDKNLPALARALNVEVSWLSYGGGNAKRPLLPHLAARQVDGSVKLLAGFVELAGARVSFPAEGDMEGMDMIMDIEGTFYKLCVVLAREDGDKVRFETPKVPGAINVIGVRLKEGVFGEVKFYNLTRFFGSNGPRDIEMEASPRLKHDGRIVPHVKTYHDLT